MFFGPERSRGIVETECRLLFFSMAHRSLSHRKPAVLVKEDAQATYYNTVPDKFRPPLLVNWTRRRVCHGSMFYSEVEHMVREMRTEQKERFQAERESCQGEGVLWVGAIPLIPPFCQSRIRSVPPLDRPDPSQARESPTRKDQQRGAHHPHLYRCCRGGDVCRLLRLAQRRRYFFNKFGRW